MQYRNGAWKEIAQADISYKGKALELCIPKKLLGLQGNAFSFDFHWCDNPDELKDPISLSTSGDSAPNRRFNYRFVWSK